MNDHPQPRAESDEEYFREGLHPQEPNDARSAHADALHADALGREITQRDIARSETLRTDSLYAETLGLDTHFEDTPQIRDAFVEESKPIDPQRAQHADAKMAQSLTEPDLDAQTIYGSYQSIDSTYFNITNRHDAPVAGLTVLMDTTGQAIRSELHLYEDSSDAEKQEAIRQANGLIKNQFSSHFGDPDSQMLELRIFDTRQKYATLYVDLPERAQAAQGAGWNIQRLWPLLAAALLLLLGGLLAWWFLTNLRGTDTIAGETTQSETAVGLESASDENQTTLNLDPNKPILDINSAQSQTDQGQVVVGQPVSDGSDQAAQSGDQGSTQTSTGQTSAEQSAAVQNSGPQLEWVNPSEVNENSLPTSVNANAAINRSSRVRVMEGLQIFLRSHPAPATGTEKGVLVGGDEAIVVGGPYWTEGENDTIVWWYVRVDENTEGWVAANTSTLTLLEPAQ